MNWILWNLDDVDDEKKNKNVSWIIIVYHPHILPKHIENIPDSIYIERDNLDTFVGALSDDYDDDNDDVDGTRNSIFSFFPLYIVRERKTFCWRSSTPETILYSVQPTNFVGHFPFGIHSIRFVKNFVFVSNFFPSNKASNNQCDIYMNNVITLCLFLFGFFMKTKFYPRKSK